MGSSCFSRGNGDNVGFVQKFIEQHALEDKAQVKGCLCQGLCKTGPNLKIGDKLFTNVTKDSIESILKQTFGV